MIKAFPDEPQIPKGFAAHDFDDMTKKLKEVKKVAQESGVPIISAMGKFQFIDEPWGSPKFNESSEVQHALVICLNAIYAGKAEVISELHWPTESTMFGVKVFHAMVKYTCANELLYDDPGAIFIETLKGMCDQVDKAGVIVEYKMPKNMNLFQTDNIGPEEAIISATPVKDSFKKLSDSGVVDVLAGNLTNKYSVKVIETGNILDQIKMFQQKLGKIEKQLGPLAKSAEKSKLALEKMELATQDLKKQFATGGWVDGIENLAAILNEHHSIIPKSSGYSDSGRLLKEKFPGINTVVRHPCQCLIADDTIHNIIMHLNDSSGHGKYQSGLKFMGKVLKQDEYWEYPAWTREQIADWTETLDVNLELKEEV